MEKKIFDALIERINNWREEYPGEPLIIEEDLPTLTELQWGIMDRAIGAKKVNGLEIYNGGTARYSQAIWKMLFQMLGKNKIEGLTLAHDDINGYTDAQWIAFFSEMQNASIKRFEICLSYLDEMSFVSWSTFLDGASTSTIEQLKLSAINFGETPDEICHLFFDKLSTCQNIKQLAFENDGLGGADNNFLSICAQKISTAKIDSLHFDSTGMSCIPKASWLELCQGLKGSSITSLSLRSNRFYNFTAEQWKWFFQGLAATSFNKLDLHEHHSLELSDDAWKAFSDGLRRTSITSLIYYQAQFDASQEKEINEILEANQKKILETHLAEQPNENRFEGAEKKNNLEKENLLAIAASKAMDVHKNDSLTETKNQVVKRNPLTPSNR